MLSNDSPVLKVSLKLNDENRKRNSLTSLEPQIGTKFSVLHCIRILFLWDVVFLTIDPFIRISVFIAKVSTRQYCWRLFEDFHSQEYIQFLWHTQLTLHCVCTSPLAVMTIVRLHDFVKVSISASLKYFLLILCIDAPESTTNSRSILKFWSVGAALMRLTWANISERRILVSNFGMTRNSLCEFHTLDWFPHVCTLPENRLRRRHVLKHITHMLCIRCTALNMSVIWLVTGVTADNGLPHSIMQLILLQHGYCTYVIIRFAPCSRLLLFTIVFNLW